MPAFSNSKKNVATREQRTHSLERYEPRKGFFNRINKRGVNAGGLMKSSTANNSSVTLTSQDDDVTLVEDTKPLRSEHSLASNSKDVFTITVQDRIVVVMGPPGAGKSTFIGYATQPSGQQLNHDLRPASHDVQMVRCNHPVDGKPVVFVDTPGFGSYDSTKSEYEILQFIADQIVQASQGHLPLSAVIYLHAISNSAIPRSPLQDLKTFTKMYRQSAMPRVTISTTMWSDVKEEIAAPRQGELSERCTGYTIERFENSRESAWDIVGHPDELSDSLHFVFASKHSVKPQSNVIVFGSAGAGKSSLINMLAGSEVAKMSGGAVGCTFESIGYAINIPGGPAIAIWDTAGLSEGSKGTLTPKEAIDNIFELTGSLSSGVSLLIYCVRGRINDGTLKNYQIFEAFCECKVPVALVVTGLEEVENRDLWWTENEEFYKREGLSPKYHACVVTTKGRKNVYEDYYMESTTVVQKMIKDACLPTPWKKERMSWFVTTATKMMGMMFGWSAENGKILHRELKRFGYSDEDSLKIVVDAFPSFVLTADT